MKAPNFLSGNGKHLRIFFFDNFEHSLSQIHPTIMRRQESDAI